VSAQREGELRKLSVLRNGGGRMAALQQNTRKLV
jgi:hypothetical protein